MRSQPRTHHTETSSTHFRRLTPTEDIRSEQAVNPARLVQHAQQQPQILTPAYVLQLQRTLGNQAVSQLLRRTAPAFVQRDGVTADQQKKEEHGRCKQVWEGLKEPSRTVLTLLAHGDSPAEVAMHLNMPLDAVSSHQTRIYEVCRASWKLAPEVTIDDPWLQQHFVSWPALPKKPEQREIGTQDTVWAGGGWKNIGDSFDYTLVVKRPDGTGAQLTYVAPKKMKPGEQPMLRLTKVVELSKRRVRALEEMSANQGTYQETEEERKARANAFTRCNAWPVKVGTAVAGLEEETTNDQGQTLNDKKTMAEKTAALQKLNPEGDARRYGAWRTWVDTPEGPKPGDVYSFWEAVVTPAGAQPRNATKIERKTGTIKHIGIFKSRRPNPDGQTETWTVVDGGQGSSTERQQIRERYRTFDIKTQIFTTGLADAGQGADPRWISGWLDLDAYYTNAETEATRADYAQWVKNSTVTWKDQTGKIRSDPGQKTRYEAPQEVKGEEWPKELAMSGT